MSISFFTLSLILLIIKEFNLSNASLLAELILLYLSNLFFIFASLRSNEYFLLSLLYFIYLEVV